MSAFSALAETSSSSDEEDGWDRVEVLEAREGEERQMVDCNQGDGWAVVALARKAESSFVKVEVQNVLPAAKKEDSPRIKEVKITQPVVQEFNDDNDDDDFPGQVYYKPLRKAGNASKGKGFAEVKQRQYAMAKRDAQRAKSKQSAGS